ncbi:hypothetical protein [Nocardioides deserti]|uniref:Uncharacterized protein n=1 Tax=Nocardioides deserti TaxID=1588644 RepID=A0ABR6UBZ9_9ACTN|nr:hypothetical protein [Nocardioides deserti]MBC2961969.1 hypothetical protein [Nocardioides deserti]GGO70683.1 hypothetical protein GCM10012276_09830 [Nocardioides deserti]
MSDQHRAPLAAFALVTMIAGGVVVQSTVNDDRTDGTRDTVAVTSTASSSTRPTPSDDVTREATGTPSSASTPATTPGGAADPAGPAERPADVRPMVPVEVFGSLPGLVAFLSGNPDAGDGGPSPSFQPEQESPGVDLGSTGGPSPTPGPTTPPPSEQPAPSGQPSPDASPSGSPSSTATSDAERPVEPSPPSSSASTASTP